MAEISAARDEKRRAKQALREVEQTLPAAVAAAVADRIRAKYAAALELRLNPEYRETDVYWRMHLQSVCADLMLAAQSEFAFSFEGAAERRATAAALRAQLDGCRRRLHALRRHYEDAMRVAHVPLSSAFGIGVIWLDTAALLSFALAGKKHGQISRRDRGEHGMYLWVAVEFEDPAPTLVPGE